MAVTLDAAGTQANGVGVTTKSYTGLTVGVGANRGLVVIVAWDGDPGAISVARWDDGATNQDLTLLQTRATANGQVCKIYGLVAPTAGNKTLVLTWANNREMVMNAVAWTDVDQTGGATSFPNSATAIGNGGGGVNEPTISIALPASGAGVSVIVNGTAAGLTSVSATQLMLYSGTGAIEAGGSRSTASGTFSGAIASTDQWAIAATGIAPTAAAGVPFVTQLGAQVAGYGKRPPSGLCSFALGAGLALLAQAAGTPFAQTAWPTPPTKPTIVSQRTHLQSRPTFYMEPAGAAPFRQVSWPLPSIGRGVLLITTQTAPLDTTSITVMTALRLTDWPVPQAKPYPTVLRTWTHARPLYYVEVPPRQQTDWPVPRAPRPPLDRLRWTHQRFAGVPEIPILPGPPIPQLDWPVPPPPKRLPSASQGFIGFYLLDDAAPLRAAGLVDRPLRAAPVPFTLTIAQSRSIALRDEVPVHQLDWPLPARRRPALGTLLTWTQGRGIQLADLKPHQWSGWTVPTGKGVVVSQRTWTQSLLGSPLSIPQVGWGPLLGLRRNRLVVTG